MQALPIMVLCPLKAPQVTDYSGTWIDHEGPSHQTVVGCLDGYTISSQADIESANRDLASVGVTVHWITQAVACQEGSLACAIAPGILVDTIERANALPGFAPIFWIAGPHEKVRAS